jgi:uncharacterized repeat protein (TIGR02543 family)
MKMKKWKKLLSAVLTAAMVLGSQSLGAVSVAAENTAGANEASIGSQEYATLANAFSAANTAGSGTIKLLKDCTLTDIQAINSNTNMTLDLAGKTLTLSGHPVRRICNNGTLTIEGDGGTIKNDTAGSGTADDASGSYGLIDNYGTLTLNGGTYTDIANAWGSAIRNRPDGTATLNDCTVNAQGNTQFANSCIYSNGDLTINGGSFTSASPANGSYSIIEAGGTCVINSYNGAAPVITGGKGAFGINSGKATINAGKFTGGAYYALWVTNDGTTTDVTVNDGTFIGKKYGLFSTVDDGNQDAGNVGIIVNGGLFSGETGAAISMNKSNSARNWGIKINGGYFTTDPSAYAAQTSMVKTGSWLINSITYNYRIIPRYITIQWSPSMIYDGNDINAYSSVSLNDDTDNIAANYIQFSGTPVTAASAGTHHVTAALTYDGAKKYSKILNPAYDFIIEKCPVTFTVRNFTKQAIGINQNADIDVKADNNKNLTSGTDYTISYEQNGSQVQPTAAGIYDICATIINSNYRHSSTTSGEKIKIGTFTLYNEKPTTYSISFEGNGGTAGTVPALDPATEGTLRTLPSNPFAKSNFIFSGWSYNSVLYQPGDTFKQPAVDVTMTAVWTPVYDINGKVTQGNDNVGIGSVLITLTLGSKQIAQTTTSDTDGTYTFHSLTAGDYNLRAEKDGIVQTQSASLNSSTAFSFNLPELKTNSVVQVAPEAPPVVVGGLNDSFQSTDANQYTEEDKKTVEAGGSIEIAAKVNVTTKPASISSITEKAKEDNNGKAATLALTIDVDLSKTVTDQSGRVTTNAAPLTATTQYLTFEFPISAEYQNKNFAVYRTHGTGTAATTDALTQIQKTDSQEGYYLVYSSDQSVIEKIGVKLNKFCTLGIAYNEAVNLIFDANGGTGTMSALKPNAGSDVTLPANTFTKSGYTFNGWNTKADGTGTSYLDKAKLTNLTADLTLYAQWANNSPGGGPAAPTTTDVVVPASSKEGSAEVKASVSDGTATISVTDEQLEKIASSTGDTAGVVKVDTSSLKIEKAVIPAKLIEAASAAKGSEGLEVVLPTGSVKLDTTALDTVKSDAITVSVESVKESDLTSTQKTALGNQASNAVIVDVNVLVNGQKKSTFNNGVITVTVPYTLKSTDDPEKLTIWFISDDGNVTPMHGTYNAATKSVSFTTTHLSTYAVVSVPEMRLSGDTRYDTMSAIVKEAFPNGCDTVVLASGNNFPDALASSALAGVKACPVVLTDPNKLSVQASELITSLKASNVIITGGEGAVSKAVADSIGTLGIRNVDRIWGNSRTETADKIAKKVLETSKTDTVIIASGNNFPDALSISAYAYAKQMPILLTGNDGNLTEESLAIAKTLKSAIIVGGQGVVSGEMETQLSSLSVKRYGGDDRYDTSKQLVDALYGTSVPSLAIATGNDFPDALAGASIAGKAGGTILLVNGTDTSLTNDQAKVAASSSATWILGGTGAVSDSVEKACVQAMK